MFAPAPGRVRAAHPQREIGPANRNNGHIRRRRLELFTAYRLASLPMFTNRHTFYRFPASPRPDCADLGGPEGGGRRA